MAASTCCRLRSRFVDTRDLPGKLGPGRMMTVPVAGNNGVPADATAVVVSVTAVEPCGDTFLTAFPCGTALPTTSIVNAGTGSIVANSAVIRLGLGAMCIYTLRADRRARRRQRLDRADRFALDTRVAGSPH